MKAPRGNANRQIVVLLASAMAGGLYGLWRALPGDWSGIVRVSTAYAVLGLIAGYWAYVWLRPRKTRVTLIGAAIGAVTLVIVCSLLPEQFVSNRVFAIIDGVFVGVFVGSLFGTAPRGASIGAGTGALFGFVLFFYDSFVCRRR
jgi:drug/metabolite transporter superfamily protein YnfA